MINIVVLISGRGSNMRSLALAAQRENWLADGVRLACVVSNRPEAAGLEIARSLGIETRVVDHRLFPDREAFEDALSEAIAPFEPRVIALAGFMRVLTPRFVDRWAGRIINIHPALLPLFKGLDTHARALAAGVRLHGCTVHFVTSELDGGAIIGQAAVPVLPDDDEESLAARVLGMEHRLYPRAARAVALGLARSVGGRAELAPEAARDLVIFPAPGDP